MSWRWSIVRRIIVTVIGLAVILLGVLLLVLPGPGIVTIIAGLGILGLEYDWAKRLAKKVVEKTKKVIKRSND